MGSVIDHFVLNFELQAGDAPFNTTIDGTNYGSNLTFTVSLSVVCLANFYGPNCSVECIPQRSSELGFYDCLGNGSKKCLPGFTGDSCDIGMLRVCCGLYVET